MVLVREVEHVLDGIIRRLVRCHDFRTLVTGPGVQEQVRVDVRPQIGHDLVGGRPPVRVRGGAAVVPRMFRWRREAVHDDRDVDFRLRVALVRVPGQLLLVVGLLANYGGGDEPQPCHRRFLLCFRVAGGAAHWRCKADYLGSARSMVCASRPWCGRLPGPLAQRARHVGVIDAFFGAALKKLVAL